MLYPFPRSISLRNGELQFPVFMPDATFGVVRSVDSVDLEGAKIQALVMNAFHLMQKPGTSTIQSLGGLHAMSGWQRPIITDSGGFQAYSLIRQNSEIRQYDPERDQFSTGRLQPKISTDTREERSITNGVWRRRGDLSG